MSCLCIARGPPTSWCGSRLWAFASVGSYGTLQMEAGAKVKSPENKGMEAYVPLYVRGTVVKGFGRGNKELGIPTANLDDGAVSSLPGNFKNGIYFGWACVDRDKDVHKMVMSVGVNPHFRNEKKSMEAHLIHEFDDDFYGSELSVVIVGYIRDEQSFASLEALIAAIHSDINQASITLDRVDKFRKIKNSPFFKPDPTEEKTTDKT